MSESIRVVCPNCQATYRLPPTVIGKSAACKQCNGKFTVKVAPQELPAAELPQPESPPASVVVPMRFADEHPPKVTYLPAPAESARPRRERPRADEVQITHRQAGRFGNGFLTMFGCLSAVVVFGGLCVLFVCGGGLTLLGIGSAGARRAAEERLAREQQAQQLAANNPVAADAPTPGKSHPDALVVPGKSGASPT